jgi:type I restriction enzyme M protein
VATPWPVRKFKDGEQLRTYDYVVANPPFFDKAWSTRPDSVQRPLPALRLGRAARQAGDYAYLLYIIRSMKGTGKAACILPHGVLFRGNAEAVIRKQLLNSGILKGVIGLPANLFYGTGIPACILVLDKENASARKSVMMIDASKGFIKDGNKNRLREQDLHRIVNVFLKLGAEPSVPGYARMVPLGEIANDKNDYNLNLPLGSSEQRQEDIQDLSAHLNGGIPDRDLFGEGSTLTLPLKSVPHSQAHELTCLG